MSWLPPLSALTLLAGAIFLSRFSDESKGNRWLGVLAVGTSAMLQGIVWSRGRTGPTGGIGAPGTFEGDPFSSFLSLVVLAALGVALVYRNHEASPSSRLLLGGTFALVGVSTRDLLLAVAAIEILVLSVLVRGGGAKRWWVLPSFFAAASFASLALVAWSSTGATDIAAVAAAGEEHAGARRLGLALLATSIAGSWVVHNRPALRFSRSLVSGMTTSFLPLVVAVSVLARLSAWLPDAAFANLFRVIALAGLGVGALGMLASTRITTFATALALERGGALAFALLGGVHGRAPFLLELAACGATLLLVAIAVEPARLGESDGPFALDDLANLRSGPSRLLLLVAALSAAPLPPFPGFVGRIAATQAVLLQGHFTSAALSAVFAFLTGAASMRLVARAFSSSSDPGAAGGARAKAATLGLALALGAVWFLGVSPQSLWEAATKAAMGIF